jgi:hypothetical protein
VAQGEATAESPEVIKLEEAPQHQTASEPVVQKDEPVRVEAKPEFRYAILGAVGRPGSFQFERMSVRMAIEAAGGLLKSADKGKIVVRRGLLKDPANSQPIQYDFKRVVDGKAPDMELLPGDVIEVPTGSPKRGFFDKLFTGARRIIAPALPF